MLPPPGGMLLMFFWFLQLDGDQPFLKEKFLVAQKEIIQNVRFKLLVQQSLERRRNVLQIMTL